MRMINVELSMINDRSIIDHSSLIIGQSNGFPHKPHPKETVVCRVLRDADARTLKGWTKRGGYEALARL